ncbi:MAG: hypothetical protein AAF611_03100 [Bacteroidota bacterium]
MEAKEQQRKGEELIETIVQRALDSTSFKNKLVANPRETVSEMLGRDLPSTFSNGKELVVEDQTDDSIVYLNIPRKIDHDNIELTLEELELVAGGGTECSATSVMDFIHKSGQGWGMMARDLYDWITS